MSYRIIVTELNKLCYTFLIVDARIVMILFVPSKGKYCTLNNLFLLSF